MTDHTAQARKITEYHSSPESRALLTTLIEFLALEVQDPARWPALETLLHRSLFAVEQRVREEAAQVAEVYARHCSRSSSREDVAKAQASNRRAAMKIAQYIRAQAQLAQGRDSG